MDVKRHLEKKLKRVIAAFSEVAENVPSRGAVRLKYVFLKINAVKRCRIMLHEDAA
ncbi:hypothetical protein O7R04_15755 [Bacillus velezensis]|uniref:hypothetical protein n=1 Tax=Bacillus TaxID=1386 RepID=UPI0013C2BAC1|nr:MULTISPECIES: hypothetical protein [Bacillus]MBD0396373.1 hypothetical protein [Bacillus sp. 2211]WBL38811.1 hypothetical protein O7R04_15755 [Bacillus velezensis]WEU35484.1 hypothetical protein NUW85_14725 [Bacillus amyloliquefaciens]